MTNKAGNQDHWLVRRANVVVWCGALLLGCAPWVTGQLSGEMNWTGFDFLLWGSMLVMAAGSFDLATRMSGTLVYRLGAGLALGLSFLTVWVTLAAGIIGDETNPLNLSFFGVLLVAAIGSVCVLFRARGMSFAMIAAAGAQAGVGVMASTQGYSIWLFTVCAASVWLASAWLFRRAHLGE